MQWEALGFKHNPLTTEPIAQNTLDLYTGHDIETRTCRNTLYERNVTIVIEGARGVGTTSFANYLRFIAQSEQLYFTPRNEIRVERGWTLDILLSVVIANIIREIELFHPDKIIKNEKFQNAKSISTRIAENYRAFGIEAFGFGVNYGKEGGISSQPIIVPSAVLGHHLEDLVSLIKGIGYKHGILIQLNNLDIGTVHDEQQMKHLFNALRDYIQTDGLSWLLVGDIGLRKFIAQEVDRLDDIINHEVNIPPVTKDEYNALIEKRIAFYRLNDKASLPIDKEVLSFLYQITKGRLRYIFGLLSRLFNSLHIGDITDRITIDIAKPMLVRLARDRITRNGLLQSEEAILRVVVKLENAPVSEIAKDANKSRQFVSRALASLAKSKLVTTEKHGRNRRYSPVLDAVIAYRAEEE